LSIQTIHFTGIKTFTLPFSGEMVTLEPSDNLITSMTLVIGNEKTALLFEQKAPSPWLLFCEKATDWLARRLDPILMI